MLEFTLREPSRDIAAQLKALADPEHPKEAMFLARSNAADVGQVPKGIRVVSRAEGTLLTTSPHLATMFQTADNLTEPMMAFFLGYPESKDAVMASGAGLVVQARDADDAVITEAACTKEREGATLEVLAHHVPPGGSLVKLSIVDALLRRVKDQN